MDKLTVSSPIGNITLFGEDNLIVRINPDGGKSVVCDKKPVFATNSAISFNELARSCENQDCPETYMLYAAEEIKAYFRREIKEFTFPVRLTVPPFSQRVYECLKKVPYGKTVTYKELGVMAGMSNGFRAIGQIMKRNPLPIVYPCHRVVASDGIGGFFCGVDIKRILLALEGNTDFYKEKV